MTYIFDLYTFYFFTFAFTFTFTMLIPVRCTTCGNMIGSKYKKYLGKVKELKKNDSESQVLTFDRPNTNVYGKVMEDVGIKRYCCKRHFLGQQEIIYKM